jgi:hypothetical protein
MRKIVLAAAVVCTAIACGGGVDLDRLAAAAEELKWGPGRVPGQIPSTGPVPDGCVRIEGGEIGQNLTLSFSGVTVTFTAWTSKTGANGEYVGFTVVASGPVSYAVKAGIRTHYGTETSWTHPEGLSGSDAKAISNVTFCPGPPGDGGTPLSGGGAPCAEDTECLSGECDSNVCARGGEGAQCEEGPRDCVSEICSSGVCGPVPTGARGDPCTDDAACWSGLCVSSTCEGGNVGQRCRDANDCKLGLSCDASTNVCVALTPQ